MEGWIKLDRDIFENEIWKNPIAFRLYLWLKAHAVYEEKGCNYGTVKVGRGQYLRSLRKLSEDLVYIENKQIKYYSIATLKRITDRLVSAGMISKQETELGTLFTILNYDKPQPVINPESGSRQYLKYASPDTLLSETGYETPVTSVSVNNIATQMQADVELETGLETIEKQYQNNNKKVKNVKKEYSPDSIEFRLSGYLFSLIKKRSGKYKPPDFNKWGIHIERMIKIDNRTPQEIAEVIKWSQEDPFWQNNILSTETLRKQFDKLYLKMNGTKAILQNRQQPKVNESNVRMLL
ncbi:MAG TPA: hypothetical protein VHO03_12340 [Ignavibacteriales bacterium]|nr:hypothetical protein [Ignavibacteriales bacterium]